MADIDVFEAAFARAYRRYLQEAPTGVDSVAVVRALIGAETEQPPVVWALTRPRIRWTPAWIGLAIVGLLLVAGLVAYAASHRSAMPSSCGPGAIASAAGPVTQIRPPFTAGATAMAFDRPARAIVLVAANASNDALETWTFDVCTNTWAEMRPSTSPPRRNDGGPLQIVYEPVTDRTILVDPGSRAVWAYDLHADTWDRTADTPGEMQGRPWLAYDATRHDIIARARVASSLAVAEYGLWTYDAATGSWAALPQDGATPAATPLGLLGYDPVADVVIWCATPLTWPQPLQVWRYDLDRGAWSESHASSRPYLRFGYGPAGTEMTYDEADARTIIVTGGSVAIYDATADHWEYPDFSGSMVRSHIRLDEATVYDPIDRRVVIYGGSYLPPATSWPPPAGPVWSDDVVAIDIASRTWLELVPAQAIHQVP